MQAMGAADRDLEQRLEAFARVRLSPDPRAVGRMRARVMREARLEFELGRSLAAAAVAPPAPSIGRRLAMPLLAAGLWLAIAVGSIAAAEPGGPLYPARLWIEQAALPAEATARTTAEIAQLEARLAEVMEAAAEGDRDAAAAALGAYRRIADALLAEAGADSAQLATVQAALDRHLDVLTVVREQLAAKGNDRAADAIEANVQRAIVHNSEVVERLEAATGAGPTADPGAAPGEPVATSKPDTGPSASHGPGKTPPGQTRP